MSGGNAADVFGDGDFDAALYAAMDGGRRDLEPAATTLREAAASPDAAAGYRARFGA